MLRVLVGLFCVVALRAQYAWFTLGEQKTLVAVVNVGGDTPSQSAVDAARQMVFGSQVNSIDHFYREASFGQAWFSGDAVGVSMPATDCSDFWEGLRNEADAAVGRVANLDLYRRRIYILMGSNCSVLGVSTLGISFVSPGGMLYAHAFYVDFPNALVLRHEAGHSLGLHHALGYTTPPSYCNMCDPADPLGGGGHTLNGPHMERLQWITQAQVQWITQDGTYAVTPLEVNDGRMKLLKIQRPITDFNQAEFIGLAYRQPIGTYNTTMHAGLTGGVSVHVVSVAAGSGAIHTMMVDDSPGSPEFYNDAALKDGGCWYDKLNRLLIRQVSHVPGVDGSADINVRFDADDHGCVRPPASVAPAPTSPPTGCVPRGKSGKCR